ncbi:deoxycytidylate deaminase [Oceanivirga salmonicida]|uniref:deoxycytidylate deaminase n=1 Tax=Oceanivirga salmonicida TaxID=1769291 RepID=UPI00083621A7|nr:dCMP deaminase family protein [Oceanivirga salmonicida]
MFKREGYISWEEYFLGIAYLSSLRSKDPVTQVGACIVKNKKIIGIGYNGFPNGSDDDAMSWDKNGNLLETKYPYVVHAELNAILNSTKNLEDSTIYVTHYPCNECAKAIVQSGISKVVYYSDKHKDKELTKASTIILNNAKVQIQKYDGKLKNINVEFKD